MSIGLETATPLSPAERQAAQSVLGESALRWDDVRVVTGGIWAPLWAINHRRAVTTFHTINIPGAEREACIDVMVHELTHVMQFEKVGAIYIPEALHAQATDGYGYGSLDDARAAGKPFSQFNREQQAQLAQDYYNAAVGNNTRHAVGYYQSYIDQLRAGEL